MTAVLIASISALAGGGIFKFFEYFLAKNKVKFDEERAWRVEYREQIEELQDDVKTSKAEADAWRLHCQQMFWDFKQFQLEMFKVLLANGIDPSEHIKPVKYPERDS